MSVRIIDQQVLGGRLSFITLFSPLYIAFAFGILYIIGMINYPSHPHTKHERHHLMRDLYICLLLEVSATSLFMMEYRSVSSCRQYLSQYKVPSMLWCMAGLEEIFSM